MSKSEISIIDSSTDLNAESDQFNPIGNTVLVEHPIQKLAISVTWNDQGWGNQKGALSVEVIDQNGDCVTWEAPDLAPHMRTECMIDVPEEIVESCKPGKTIQLSCRVGGGGGHVLTITSLKLVIESIPKRLAKLKNSKGTTELKLHNFGDNLDLDFVMLAELTQLMEEKIKQRENSLTFQNQSLSIHIPKIAAWKNKVKLDVGGQIFSTTKETLMKHDSLLSKLFSEENDIEIDTVDGSFIIDRSPEYFPLIIEFLRDGEVASFSKMKKDEKELVLEEAKYYSLIDMINTLGKTEKKKKKSNKVTCPGKHKLTKFYTPSYGYGCDMCKARDGFRTNINSGVLMYGCRTCNWDACESCYIGKPKPAEEIIDWTTSVAADDDGLDMNWGWD